jgi:hypothetical protein
MGFESGKTGLARRGRGLLRRSTVATVGATAAAFAAAAPAAATGPLAPSVGRPPARLVVPSFQAPQFVGQGKAAKPATSIKARTGGPIRSPASVVRRPMPPASAATPGDRAAYWDGRQYRLNPALRAPLRPDHRLGIPMRQQATSGLRPFTPLAPSSVQVDGSDNRCASIGANEEQVAESSVDPDLVIVAAQAFSDGTDCSDSHPFVFYSHDGGQHWHQQVMPGMVRSAGGDPSVVFDPVRLVFVYSFTEFDRDANGQPINARIEAESSTDGTVWGNHVVLALDGGGITTDKPMITVDGNPASPHYGRVEVTWTEFTSGGSVFLGDYSDSGGFSWQGANRSINTTASNCGNGTSPAFDANGELMTAYLSCNGGDSVREDLSTDGGATWTGADVTISAIGAIGDPDAGTCMLNTPATGSQFRCNSDPSLAGDPNPSDAGGRAFAVVWANAESGIAQIRGLSTADAGGSWTNPFFGAANNNGDKFFPWLSIAGNGRVDIGYSSREGSVTPTNPKGTTFNEHHTDAASLARLRGGTSGEFVTYSIDDTPSDPGSLDFIGDYSGQASQDNSLDTYPVWTDLRDGSRHTRMSQLCYAICYTGLAPDTTLTFGHPTGSSFTDLFRFNTDPAFGGAGAIFWNVVGIRNGSDGTVIDNDMRLFDDRYFSSLTAASSFSPPVADYVLENDNRGHAPSKPYYLDVHSFATLGGPYWVQWDAGQVHLGPAERVSMNFSDIVRVFDSFDQTGSTVFVGLRPEPGNTSDYSLAVHSAAGPNTQGAPLAVASSGRVGSGNPAFVQYSTGANPSDSDGVVVVNNNGGAGTFTLYRDTATPTGAVQVNGGATATNSTAATLTLSATNPTSGDPVLDMRFSTDGGSTWSAPVPFATTANISLPAGDGVKTVLAQFRNGAGAWSNPASDTITLDTTGPTVTAAPAPALVANTNVAAGLVPVRIAWAATDSSSGVCSYQLQERVGGTTFTNVSLPTPTTTQLTRQESSGTSYRYQVRATDCAGNPSAFRLGRQFTVRAFQESDPAIAFSTGWTTTAQAGAFGGQAKTASMAGKTATFSFSGALSVAWVATKDASSGGAHVLLDNATSTAINLNSAPTLPGRLVYVRHTSPSSPHTVQITADGTARNPKVTVDAFVVIQ